MSTLNPSSHHGRRVGLRRLDQRLIKCTRLLLLLTPPLAPLARLLLVRLLLESVKFVEPPFACDKLVSHPRPEGALGGSVGIDSCELAVCLELQPLVAPLRRDAQLEQRLARAVGERHHLAQENR
eukprot:scaffold251599_cov28-Tisochrysis_lutea.AAC.3